MCEGCEERVLINWSGLGFMAAVRGGKRGKATERAHGARALEKSRGISLKSNDLEDKVTETSKPSFGSWGKETFAYSFILIFLIPTKGICLFPTIREWASVSCLYENTFYWASHSHAIYSVRERGGFSAPDAQGGPFLISYSWIIGALALGVLTCGSDTSTSV